MNSREQWLSDSLQRYLDRRSIPQGLRDKTRAIADEAAALVKSLLRCAPKQGYQEWWDEFSERLAEDAQTRAWPTEGEIKKAAIATPAQRQSHHTPADWTLDPMRVNEKRILAGEPVGEDWIWGRNAFLLVRETAVTEDMLSGYRQRQDAEFRDLYEPHVAERMMSERRAKHAAANAEGTAPAQQRDIPRPQARRMA